MKLEITDELYAQLMSALRVLEARDPHFANIRKLLLAAMLEAVSDEISA